MTERGRHLVVREELSDGGKMLVVCACGQGFYGLSRKRVRKAFQAHRPPPTPFREKVPQNTGTPIVELVAPPIHKMGTR